jgi:LysR family transcriptional regulator, glycine cleavage system transcriptional activator
MPRSTSARNRPRKKQAALRRLPLASLRVFVATAEQLSFTRAAQMLGVTAGAVSMQIKALEEYLQQPLFRRRGRLVELTSEGERLLPRVRSGLEQLEQAIDEARHERSAGPLTVSTLTSFLQQWLLPRLPDFNQKFPDIDLRIHTSASLVDFRNRDVQAAIRLGTGNWAGLYEERVLDEWLIPVCAPRLLEKHGPVFSRTDLKRYNLLHSISEPWRLWPESATIGTEWAPRGATFDDSVTIIRAAEAGQGLALARWSLAAKEIESGRLVIASRIIKPLKTGYYFVCPPSYRTVDKVVALRTWLVQQAKAAPKPPPGLGAEAEPADALVRC